MAAAALSRRKIGRSVSGGRAGTWKKDRKSTRLNSSHVEISYAVFCLKKKSVDAGVRLDVGVRRSEELAGVLGRHGLDGVDVLAAGVEPVADGALGVLVAEPGAHGQEHCGRGVVLARDELEGGSLVGELLPSRLGDARLDGGDDLQSLGVSTAGQSVEVGHEAEPSEGPGDRPTRLVGRTRCDLRRSLRGVTRRSSHCVDIRLTSRDRELWDVGPRAETP